MPMMFHHVTVDVVTVVTVAIAVFILTVNRVATQPIVTLGKHIATSATNRLTFDVVPLRYTVNTTNKGHKKMMTRKDYVAVADILNRYALSIDENTFDILIHDFAGLMAKDNERFIADRFISACWNGTE